MNHKQIQVGRDNLAAVRAYFKAYPCATNVECSHSLGINVNRVGKHVRTIRSEYAAAAECPKSPRLEFVVTDVAVVVERCCAKHTSI